MSAFDLTGKTAVVTGSTSGIGVGVAHVLAAQGARVVVTGRREQRGEKVVAEIAAEGGGAVFHRLDIMDEGSVAALVEDVVAQFGAIDVLINNAASTSAKDGNVADISAEDWDHMLASDLRSVFLMCKHVIPHMRESGGGSIVNIGSSAGVSGNDGWSAYGPAKAGVSNLTKNIAYQYGKDNIRCNCIHPGLIVTPENDALMPQVFKDIYLHEIDVNRYGCPEDIGYAALFFASDESAFVTATDLLVDGGMMSHGTVYGALRTLAAQSAAAPDGK